MHTGILKKLLLLFVFLLIILGSIGYFYYNRWERDIKQASNIPYILASSAIVYDLSSIGKQWDNFRETSIWQDVEKLPFFTRIQENLDQLIEGGINKTILDELPLS